MLGTLLVGAANALAKENLPPAQMLSRLNESLYVGVDLDSTVTPGLTARL
jgi:hypothetical protein